MCIGLNQQYLNQQLEQVIGKIQQKFGSRAIQQAGHIQLAPPMLDTGFDALNDMCRIPCGHVSTITGRPTSGMTTLMLHLMASAQRSGRNIVYLDSGDTFHSSYALGCGVSLDKLLLIEAHAAPLLLDIMREIVSSGVVDLLVVNTFALRHTKLDLRPIMTSIHSSACAVMMLTRPHFEVSASLRLSVQRQSWLRDGRDVVGCMSNITVTRNRFGAEGQSTMLLLPFPQEAVL